MVKKSEKRILSGMQATGPLHLGHYLGVLTNYVKLQQDFDCFFMVANLHSLTIFYPDYENAHQFIAPLVSDWLAAGLNPEESVLFVQSDVPEHAELALLLSMFTPVPWLTRNPTYKDKQQNIEKDIDSLGFLGYPVLQAADILLYRATHVPIGEDQLPHLELSREIARRFNHFYSRKGKEMFTIPQAVLSEYPKVPGTDGRKMSKSYNNTIDLSEPELSVTTKLKQMKTDTNRIRRNDPGNPENCGVYAFYDFFLPEKKDEVARTCRTAELGCVDCKMQILKPILEKTAVFRQERAKNQERPDHIKSILREGALKARKSASETLAEVRDILGMSDNYVI